MATKPKKKTVRKTVRKAAVKKPLNERIDATIKKRDAGDENAVVEKETESNPGRAKWFIDLKDGKKLTFETKPLARRFIQENNETVARVILGHEKTPRKTITI